MTITTIITNEWLTFKDLEQKLEIAGPTLRRWSEKFPTFLGGKKINRVLSFPASSLEVFKLIKQLFDDGNDTAAVMAALTREMTQTHDVKPIPKDAPPASEQHASAPALPEVMAQLIPLAERFVAALESIARELASNRPSGGFGHRGDIIPHVEGQTGQDGQAMKPVAARQDVIARIWALHGEGLGQYAITTRLRREGLRLSPRGEISKSTVARILKDKNDGQ